MEKWAYVGKLNTRGNGREQKMTGLPIKIIKIKCFAAHDLMQLSYGVVAPGHEGK